MKNETVFKKTYNINDNITIQFYKYDADSFFKYKLYINGYFRGKGLVNTTEIFNTIIKELYK